MTDMICLWCARPMRFDPKNGWVHADTGKLYVTRVDADGVVRDDHCGIAVPGGRPHRASRQKN